MRAFHILMSVALLFGHKVGAAELPDLSRINIETGSNSDTALIHSPVDVDTDVLQIIDGGADIDPSLDTLIHVDSTIDVQMEELTAKVFDASLIVESLMDVTTDSSQHDNLPDEFVDLLTPQGQLAEGAFQDQLMSSSTPLTTSSGGNDAVPCRVFLGDDLNVSFSEASSDTVSREVSLLVQCDEGVNYRLSATNGVEEKARFIAALESEDGRQPAMIDVRHPSGHALSTYRYVGSGEPQALPIQLTLFSAGKQALLGHVRPVEDIRLELDIVR